MAAMTFLGSKRILLVLSVAVACVGVVYVSINHSLSEKAFRQALHREGETLKASFDIAMEQVSINMLTMATYIAESEQVQQTFLAGKRAVRDEGGGAGGPQAAHYRQALLDLVGPAWEKVQARFYARQLQFHLGPGSTSFLRVHEPDRFGDTMDDVRFTVVDTNRELTPRTGFETGRVYSGLRGVVPVFADDEAGRKVHVGALELGTSFSTILEILDARYGKGVGIMLTEDHVRRAMWPDYLEERFGHEPEECGCVIEAASRKGFMDVVHMVGHAGAQLDHYDVHLQQQGDSTYAIVHFPLRDYRAMRDSQQPVAGAVIFWWDATRLLIHLRRDQRLNIVAGVLGFALIELLLLIGFRYATARLEQVVDGKTSELEQANQNLSHAVRVRNRLFSIISHDLRSPFTAILGNAELMTGPTAKNLDRDRLLEMAKTVRMASERAFFLLEDLLSWARVQMDGGETDRHPVLLDKIVEGICDTMEMTAQSKRIALTYNTQGLSVLADAEAVRTILRNLVANALKFTPHGGAIRVSARPEGEGVRISVADTGTGIDPAVVADLFKVDVKTTTKGLDGEVGTGLGLPLCAELVAVHGGEIAVEPNPGGGSLFVFTLPAVPPGWSDA